MCVPPYEYMAPPHEYVESSSDTRDTEVEESHNSWKVLTMPDPAQLHSRAYVIGSCAGWHCRATSRWTCFLVRGVVSRGAIAIRSAGGFADGDCGQPQHLGQGVLEVIGAHVMERRRQMMLLREQCQRSRAVLFFSDNQTRLRVTELGGVIFVLWVNWSERQARQVCLGRMVALVPHVSPVKVFANAEIVILGFGMSMHRFGRFPKFPSPFAIENLRRWRQACICCEHCESPPAPPGELQEVVCRVSDHTSL